MTYIPDHFETPDDGEDPAETAEEFLRDLGERMMHLAPAAIGTDQYHSDRLYAIAESIAKSRAADDARISALEAEIARCHARLEIDHCYRFKGTPTGNPRLDFVRVEIPYEERLSIPDGIECRDIEKLLRQARPDAPPEISFLPLAQIACDVVHAHEDMNQDLHQLGPVETPGGITYFNAATKAGFKFRVVFYPVLNFSTRP